MWQQFGEDPFLFQYDCAYMHRARFIKTLELGVACTEL